MLRFAVLALISFAALAHSLFTKKGVAWALVIVLLGPLGGVFYLLAYFNLLPFKPPKALQMTATSSRRCPRCHQPAGVLHEYEDGRKVLRICQMCKSEMELQKADFKLPL